MESSWTQKLKIKFVDTKKQLADILTKGNFTRDEWNHLLGFFQHYESFDVLLQPFQSCKSP